MLNAILNIIFWHLLQRYAVEFYIKINIKWLARNNMGFFNVTNATLPTSDINFISMMIKNSTFCNYRISNFKVMLVVY